MVDKLLRGPKEQIMQPVALAFCRSVHPTALTVVAAVAGLAAAAAIAQGAYGLGLVGWAINRTLDGLDGTVARVHGKQSDLGGYLDIVLDTLIYAAIPIALVVGQATPAAYLSLVALLGSFYLNGASWMFLAALLEKRKQGARQQGELTTITMPSGLIEGTETVIFYTLFLVLPQATVGLFWIMAALVGVTVIQRLVWAVQWLR